MSATRGLCIIALGNPLYGEYAYNLAMSVKFSTPDFPICLLKDEQGISRIKHLMNMFDTVIDVPKECVTSRGLTSLIRSKVCLYDMSPFDETLFIDADVIMFNTKSVNDIIKEVEHMDFAVGTRHKQKFGSKDSVFQWVKKKEDLRSAFGFDDETEIYNLSSEVMWFKKKENVKMLFDIAKEVFDNPKVELKRFAGTVPDEFAFQVALVKTGIIPAPEDQWLPFYWEHMQHKNLGTHELYKEKWNGYSIGGNMQSSQQKKVYDALSAFFARQFGLKRPFTSKNKKDSMPLRNAI
jgi:hypothetical protein